MKFEYVPYKKKVYDGSISEWRSVLKSRRMMAAAECSSSAATGRPKKDYTANKDYLPPK